MPWEWLLYVLLVIVHVVGLFLNILGLPGLWLMVAAHIGYAWATGWNTYVGWPSVVIIVVLALLAEAVEFLAGAAGSKAAGGSKRGMAGAIAGGIIGGIVGTGLIPIPAIGTIIGAVAGAGFGAFVVEMGIGRSKEESATIAIGAAKGRFWGILGKSLFGVFMFITSVLTAFPLGGAAAAPATGAPLPPPTTAPALPGSVSPTTLPATLPTTQVAPIER
jgi:uncharacterized protein YqgC (DUF456 family)